MHGQQGEQLVAVSVPLKATSPHVNGTYAPLPTERYVVASYEKHRNDAKCVIVFVGV
jgi:hypothetical protein